jgi:hypothetical protein
MSRLITSGDTIANFGELLPAPYIKQIYIASENTGDEDAADPGYGTIDVVLDIYVSAPEDADDEAIIKGVLNYYIYWHVLSTSTNAGAGGSTTEANWDIDDLINKRYSIWEIVKTDEAAGWKGGDGTGKFTLSSLVPADEELPEYEVVYDTVGNRLLKFTYSSADEEQTLTLDMPDKGSEATSSEGIIWNDDGVEYDSDVYLFAWSTAPGAPPPAAGSSGLRPPTGFVLPSDNTGDGGEGITGDRWTTFLDLQTSDIAYELVWTDGASAVGEESLWVDDDGNAFDGEPLQSISSQYYSTSAITHSEIVSSFRELLENYEDLGETDSALQDIAGQISYILVIYKDSAELLTQLNFLLRAFPSKSSVTNVGSLYIEYREKIYTANAVVETGTPLFKKIVTNTKVIDLRDIEFEWAEVGEDEGRRPDDGDETYMYYSDDTYMATNMKFGTTSFYNAADGETYYNNYGFFFFDYDKALYETAAIGEYFSMNGLFNIFGKSFLNNYFRISKAIYSKEDSGTLKYMIAASFVDDDDVSVGYKLNEITHEDPLSSTYGDPYISDSSVDEVAYSFILLRNFQLAKEGGLNDYRVMCFEFQDLRAVYPWTDYMSAGAVYVRDGTLALIGELITAYTSAMDGLEEYYELAFAECAFNTIDGRWKDSFAEDMHNTYDGDIGNAPWIFYPVYYCLHQDLLTKEFGGDLVSLMDEARKISAKINPDYGTQEELTAFKANFDGLYDTFYADGADSAGGDLSAVAEANGADDYTTRYYFTTWDNVDLDENIYEYSSEETIGDVTAYAVPGTAVSGTDELEIYYSSPSDGDTGVEFGEDFQTYIGMRWWGYGTDGGSFYDTDGNEIENKTPVTDMAYVYNTDTDTPLDIEWAKYYRVDSKPDYNRVLIKLDTDSSYQIEAGTNYAAYFVPDGAWVTAPAGVGGSVVGDVVIRFFTAIELESTE